MCVSICRQAGTCNYKFAVAVNKAKDVVDHVHDHQARFTLYGLFHQVFVMFLMVRKTASRKRVFRNASFRQKRSWVRYRQNKNN